MPPPRRTCRLGLVPLDASVAESFRLSPALSEAPMSSRSNSAQGSRSLLFSTVADESFRLSPALRGGSRSSRSNSARSSCSLLSRRAEEASPSGREVALRAASRRKLPAKASGEECSPACTSTSTATSIKAAEARAPFLRPLTMRAPIVGIPAAAALSAKRMSLAPIFGNEVCISSCFSSESGDPLENSV